MKNWIRCWNLFGVSLLLLSFFGCGRTEAKEVPKLLEPVAANSAYRPAERGNIGNVEVVIGTVVPTDYAHFFRTSVSVSEILVEVGDVVNAGDVIAYADCNEAVLAKQELQDQLSMENTVYDINCNIAELEKKQLVDSQGSKEAETELAVREENARYDKALHEYRVKKFEEEIAGQQEVIDDGVLRARHGGTVTYVKNIVSTREAAASENLVTISDYEAPYIELQINSLEYSRYSEYKLKYIKAGEAEYPLEEKDYTSEELILAKLNNAYPYVRLVYPEGMNLDIGENCLACYRRQDIRDVLLVGKDSLNYDENGCFIYVKTENSEKERREITLGASDRYYAEVTGGLFEGELVYYQSLAKMPESDNEYTIERSDFAISNFANEYETGTSVSVSCFSEYEGTIEELAVTDGSQVEEGDLLYVIDTGEGKAALTEAEMNIDRENESYSQTCRMLDEQIAAYDAQIDALGKEMLIFDRQITVYKKQLAQIQHDSRLAQLQEIYNKLQQNNDGTGKISVYADFSGEVSFGRLTSDSGDIKAAEGEKVKPGEEIMRIVTVVGDNIVVNMEQLEGNYPYDIANLGEKVTFSTEEGSFSGTCIGLFAGSGSGKRIFLGTDENGAYFSAAADDENKYPSFYVAMEDSAFNEKQLPAEIMFHYLAVTDVVVLPNHLLQKEETPAGENDFYVWLKKDGQLVKQYIWTDPKLSTNTKTVVLSGLKEGDVVAAD